MCPLRDKPEVCVYNASHFLNKRRPPPGKRIHRAIKILFAGLTEPAVPAVG